MVAGVCVVAGVRECACVCLSICVCACEEECVYERESVCVQERERERIRVYICVYSSVIIHSCICMD